MQRVAIEVLYVLMWRMLEEVFDSASYDLLSDPMKLWVTW